MPNHGDRRALIIGGSISGLLAALLLRRSGWQVDVFERTETELAGRGAGIVTHPELNEVLVEAGVDPGVNFGVEIVGRTVLDRDGRVVAEHARRQIVTSWDRLFRMLSGALPRDCYHSGKELIRVEERVDRVVAHFADGAREGDVLVGADGFRSTVRVQCMPEAQPVYAGYVAWRGLVAEQMIPHDIRRALFEQMVFCLPPGEQMLGYPVAGVDNDLRTGHRRYNFVWYRPADETGALQDLLTDESGTTHALSIPPPLIRQAVTDEFRKAARDLLAPQLQEILSLAPEPFLQPIYDLKSPRMASGRVVIIGDAAFVGRPHVAAGVTKAAHDARALASALQAESDVARALECFEQARIAVNRSIVDRGRELGACLEARSDIGAQPNQVSWHPTPEAVMKDIAVLDFLHG